MIIIETQKSDVEPSHAAVDGSGGDSPPAYDALSIHQPREAHSYASFSALPSPVVGSSRSPPMESNPARPPFMNTNKSLPPPPLPPPPAPSQSPSSTPAPVKDNATRNASSMLTKRAPARKLSSWLSLLPFAPTFSAKRVRQSVMSTVSDLVVPQSRRSGIEQRSSYEILASMAETCVEHKLSLSTILQEPFIGEHTPMYWAAVNYREELLVSLLFHSRPLSFAAISDIRRACLASSNQILFHALRVCRPPFHATDGVQFQNLRTASENLLLGNRPLDEIRIQRSNDQGFIVSFNINLWQSRIKAIGYVSFEFIVCGRMWTVSFFSTNSPFATAASGKSKKRKQSWYIMVGLLESSPPTFFNSQLVVDIPSPLTPEPPPPQKLRETQSMILPSARDNVGSRSSMYDYNDGIAHGQLPPVQNVAESPNGNRGPSPPLPHTPPPVHPLRGLPSSTRLAPAPLYIRLEAGGRKLGCRNKSEESSKPMETPVTKPDTWSDHGVGYTSAVVSPVEEGDMSLLLCENSRYLLPDGTLRGRLEARFTKSKPSKDCVIC